MNGNAEAAAAGPGADGVMAEMGAAIERGRSGDRAGARDTLAALWERVGDDGDALHRCSIAHYLADLQDSVADELRWDQRALAAAGDLSDGRARRYDDSFRVRAFLPSLHLNLADAYRRSGRAVEAREHLRTAIEHLDALPADEYGAMLRAAVVRVRDQLAAGSTAALASDQRTS
jgi:hypothetical protein